MSHTTVLRRTGSALGATALLGIVLAAPAIASPDPGTEAAGSQATATATGGSIHGLDRVQREGVAVDTSEGSGVNGLDRSLREGVAVDTSEGSGVNGLDRSLREGVPAAMDRERQLGGYTYSREVSTLPLGSGTSQGATKPSTPTVVRIEDHTIEYLQVGAGVLAGAALVGAGVAVASRRSHRGLTPA